MKAKIKREGNKLDITIKGNTFTKYINRCILCGNETIDDINKGTKHICDYCYDLFENNKTRSTVPKDTNKEEKKITKMGFVENKERTINPNTNTIMRVIDDYKPSIKIVNLVDYQNLMSLHDVKLNGKTIVVMIDLIVKGINTANKMAKHFGITNPKTINSIRTYLRRMERFAMITKHKRTINERINDNIFSVNRGLVYTQC